MKTKISKSLKCGIGAALLLSCVFFSAFVRKSETNFRVAKAISLKKTVEAKFNTLTLGSASYEKNCPDGSTGCGGSSGIPCSGSECGPIIPAETQLRLVPCSNNSPSKACTQSVTGTACNFATSCPAGSSPVLPNHVLPCNYGSPSYGCFAGQPTNAALACTTLVNCQNPPD